MDLLTIGESQHRVDSVGAEIDELAENIKSRGLLQPIRVVKASAPNDGKYEIIMGQRRYLACRQLGFDTITCIISEQKTDKLEYLIDSISENTLRKDTSTKENKDACAILWRRFGSIRVIREMTGLSDYFIRKHVKWATLPQKLRDAVDSGEVQLDAATKAVEVQEYEDNPNDDDTLEIAKQMSKLSAGQRKKVTKTKKANTHVDAKKIVEKVETEDQIPTISVSLTRATYDQVEKDAKADKMNIADYVSDLVESNVHSSDD
jgi:ParB family chromosome partitioning protein